MYPALRVASVLHALAVLMQPILAGLFLSGRDGLIDVHANNGTLILILSLVQSVLVILCYRRRLLPRTLIGQSVGILLAEGIELGVGFGHVLWLHIPLGTILLVGVVDLVRKVMTARPAVLEAVVAEAAE